MQTVLCSRSGVHTTSDLQVRTQVSNPTNDFTWTSPPCPDMADQADPTGRNRPVKGEQPVWPGSSARKKPVDIACFRQLDEHWQAAAASMQIPCQILPDVRLHSCNTNCAPRDKKEGHISACSLTRSRCLVVLTSFTTCHLITN